MHPALAAPVLATLVPLALAAAPETGRPNVLLIIADDLRAEPRAFGGRAETPHLDRLAAEGVRFDRAYVQYPLCNPSRTSMLTGRDPTHTRVFGNREWFGSVHPDWVSLPRHFKDHGYVTVRSGKIFHDGLDDTEAWSEGGEARRFGEAPGGGGGTRSPVTADEQARHLSRVDAQDRGRAAHSDRWEAAAGDTTSMGDSAVADRAIEGLRRHARGDRPFFLACGFSKPHSPLVAPARFFEQYPLNAIALPPDFAPRPTVPAGFPAGAIRPRNADLFIGREASPEAAREAIRAYRACVSYVDWNVGRLLDELQSLGLRKNTIVVFWGDNGYQLGEKGKWSKAGSLWEQGTRVPFIVHDPRARGNGRASPRTVQALDIYPTLVDLCGLPRPGRLDGVSLKRLLDRPDASWSRAAFSVWSERGRWLSGVAVRDERWRYAEFYGPGAGAMLLDAAADPDETRNLAGDPRHAAVVKKMSAALRRYAASLSEPSAEGPANAP